MRILKDQAEYQGTPQELASFFELTKEQSETPFDYPAPIEDIISQSQLLRNELSRDPGYNPFPGVVPSKESENSDPNPAIGFADMDTGVQNE